MYVVRSVVVKCSAFISSYQRHHTSTVNFYIPLMTFCPILVCKYFATKLPGVEAIFQFSKLINSWSQLLLTTNSDESQSFRINSDIWPNKQTDELTTCRLQSSCFAFDATIVKSVNEYSWIFFSDLTIHQ